LWQRNYFVEALPWMGALASSPSMRALVVATGVVTVLAGMTDLRAALLARLARRAAARVEPPEPTVP
jgi:hypothetical protein